MTFYIAWAPPESDRYISAHIELADDGRPARERIDEMARAFAEAHLPSVLVTDYRSLSKALRELGSGIGVGWND